MAALCRSVRQLGKYLVSQEFNRNISLSASTHLREIITKKEDKVLIVEGRNVPQMKEHLLVKLDSQACPLCATQLDVKHTDVLILRQFLQSDGTVLPLRVSGLCEVQHKRVSILIKMAQRAGLLPGVIMEQNPAVWETFNSYYDEDTIKHKYKR
ncbi:hypothetical protein PUN28_017056 [Cardiocondyla obscurior]|uniref:Ribosomal protein S18 n=1 Tax=Cardiocondyla obscurior TaxID=286306 RepID=A0AAW2EK41_9HYME